MWEEGNGGHEHWGGGGAGGHSVCLHMDRNGGSWGIMEGGHEGGERGEGNVDGVSHIGSGITPNAFHTPDGVHTFVGSPSSSSTSAGRK